MPLRRPFSLIPAGVCLCLALGAKPQPDQPKMAHHQAGAVAVEAPATPATLLAAARPYLADAASLPASPGSFPGEGVVELYHMRFEQVLPDGLSGVVEQRVFQIRDRDTAAMFVPDDLWYDSSRSHFQLQQAQVLRGGAILNGADRGDWRNDATGNQPRRVDLPELRAGDRVNIVYLLLPDSGPKWSLLDGHFLGNLFAFRDDYPILHARYIVAAPAPIAFSQVGVAAPRLGRARTGEATWEWSAENQPAFFAQNNGPALTDASPFVQVSGFDSWAAMATWYSGLLAQRAQLGPGFERTLLRAADAASPRAPLTPAQIRSTVARIWAYLAPRLGYRGDESGVHAYVPAPVKQVFQARRGDCKDGALLLVTWLRAAGVEADLALVRTRSMGALAPSVDGRVAATMAAFDHALVYIPATRQWIDTTVPNFLTSELPASDQGALALIVRAGQRGLVHVATLAPADNITRRSVTLYPLGNGQVQAEGEIEVRGSQAPEFRARFADPGRQKDALQAWLRSYFPSARVSRVSAVGIAPAAATVHVQFVAQIAAPPHLSVAWIRRDYENLLASQTTRDTFLDLPLRWESDETWSLPVATCAGFVPEPLAWQAPFGRLDLSSTCQDGRLRVTSRVLQTANRIPPQVYPQFRAFWQAVDTKLDSPAPLPLLRADARLLALETLVSR